MGPELLLPALLSAGGTALQMSAQNDAAGEKRSVLNRQLARDKTTTGKAVDLVNQQAQMYAPDQRVQNMTNEENQIFDQSQKDLAQGAGGATNPVGTGMTTSDAGNVSDDFLKSKADRAVTEGTRLTAVAREIAKARSPLQLQNTEAKGNTALAGDLSSLFSSNKNMASATSNDADAVTTPAYGALGSIASGIGQGMAASKLAAAKSIFGTPSSMFAGTT